MATPREVRRLAFQTLYQLDARGGADATPDHDAVLSAIMDEDERRPNFTSGETKKSFLMASEAYSKRAEADAFMLELAPTWPAHRQAAVDRAILRLAYYEMNNTQAHPKIVVNEAVELAKEFSTEKSPAFVNGLLDKALRKVLKERGEDPDAPAPIDASVPPAADSPLANP
ncbi:MAG: transcription antitermination factor NusB [Phycisphaerales bacterium]|nr:transcription antitermination factor NusB [Phycisphaerales bacterium]